MPVIHQVFSRPELLNVPVKRAAWSDRTALLMAEMSKLAYYDFEIDTDGQVMLQDDLDLAFERMLQGADAPDAISTEEGEGTNTAQALPAGALRLKDDLAKAGFELAGLFSNRGVDTQAFLAVSKPDDNANVRPFGQEEVAILSFRGTANIKDWLTNVKAYRTNVQGTVVHAGFQAAFDAVEPAIRKKLDPLIDEGRTLYITGHSLGGALAMIATRETVSDSQGACYTFGSPRVGQFGFSNNIKTPIYRVVNANDLVPRIPTAYLQLVLSFVLNMLNFPLAKMLSGIIRRVPRYVHYGDMRFLRTTKRSDYSDLQVLSNPSVIYRFMWYWPALIANIKSPIENHSIDLYCEKLAAYAAKRLLPLVE